MISLYRTRTCKSMKLSADRGPLVADRRKPRPEWSVLLAQRGGGTGRYRSSPPGTPRPTGRGHLGTAAPGRQAARDRRARGRAIHLGAGRWRNLRLIHLPVHASWLNRAELCFSILQRRPDFGSLEGLVERLLAFGHRCREATRPFEWTFTRADRERVLERVDAVRPGSDERPERAQLPLAA